MVAKYFVIFLGLLTFSRLCKLQEIVEQQESEFEHEFEEILEEIGANSTELLYLTELELILQNINETCLTAEDVFQAVDVPITEGLTGEKFAEASIIILYYYIQPSCNIVIDANLSTIAKQDLLEGDTLCKERLETILTEIQDGGKYSANVSEDSQQCFGAGSLIQQTCHSDDENIYLIMVQIIRRLNRGDCFLPKSSDFVTSLFEYYGATNKISDEVFSDILAVFSIGGVTEDDHDDHDHDHDHEDEKKKRKKRNAQPKLSKCYSNTELLDIFGEATTIDAEKFLDSENFVQSCPAILQQHITAACNEKPVSTDPTTITYTKTQKYGYATASVLLISLLAFGGLLFFPSIGTRSYKLTMQFFIALGVGTLSGDALLHLLPEVVGLHGHEEGGVEDEHAHDEEEESQEYIWRILVVIGGIYMFYLFENVLRLWNRIRGTNLKFHVHSEDDHHHHIEDGNDGSGHHTVTNTVMQSEFNHHNASVHDHDYKNERSDVYKNVDDANGNEKINTSKTQLADENGNKKESMCFGFTPIAIMVLIGDILHNFGDGLALGVAFSSSWVSGVGASIAIFCHELPHEFGDFAIYMNNGMSKWQALLMNFFAACFAFIGLYIGLSIAENAEAREWMLAVIAGMFLYIALVDVMHEMIEEHSDRPVLQFFLQNLGMLLGWTILLLLALYEDQIRTVLT